MTSRTIVMAKLFMLMAAGVATTGGCVSDEEDDEVSAVGVWNATITWGNGTCGEMGSGGLTVFTVTQNGNAYVVASSEPDVTTTGTVSCSAKQCTLSATQSGTDDDTGGDFTVTWNLTLLANKSISGGGNLNVPGTCMQAFTATGTRP